jgi:signal transduction histidine kinase
MVDKEKSKEHLISELWELRKKVAELETSGKQTGYGSGVRSPNHHLSSYLVDGKYGIKDLVDVEALRTVFTAFSEATGFTAGLVEYPLQKVLIATGWRDICAKFHRAFPDSLRQCKKSNALLTEKLREPKRLCINECENGLMDGATPIIIKGTHIASITTGQVFFQRPHLEYFRRQAEQFRYDPHAYMEAVTSVPVIPESQFRNALFFLRELGTMIAELGMNILEIRETMWELEQEIRERKQTEKALQRSKDELRRLSSQLLIAQEDERKRIAGELHDSLGSHLTAIRFTLETARKQLERGGANPDCLDGPIAEIQRVIGEVRRIWTDLRPSILDNLGLIPALDWFLNQYEVNYQGICIEREFSIEENRIPEPLKIVIFRIVQEALNNIAKHSNAEQARLSLIGRESLMELIIEDHGDGFDLESVMSNGGKTKGIGLTSMRERAELSGGVFLPASHRGEGTKICISWPL